MNLNHHQKTEVRNSKIPRILPKYFRFYFIFSDYWVYIESAFLFFHFTIQDKVLELIVNYSQLISGWILLLTYWRCTFQWESICIKIQFCSKKNISPSNHHKYMQGNLKCYILACPGRVLSWMGKLWAFLQQSDILTMQFIEHNSFLFNVNFITTIILI